MCIIQVKFIQIASLDHHPVNDHAIRKDTFAAICPNDVPNASKVNKDLFEVTGTCT